MIGVDLFAGAGGMTSGALQAGIDVRLAVEFDPDAANTYRNNFPSVSLIADDIASVKAIEVGGQNDQRVLFGGPPCQGFSTSNQRTRGGLNPKNWLFKEFIRVAKLWSPDWVVFENVKGITEVEQGRFLESVMRDLEHLGYTCSSYVLNSADYGVPQRRNRLFIVGSLHGRRVSPPLPQAAPRITVEEAIDDLPTLGNGASTDVLPYRTKAQSPYARHLRADLATCSGHLVTRNAAYVLDRYKHVREGGNWQDIPPELMSNYKDRTRCHTGIYHRLKSDSPSVVIGNYRKNMLIHPKQNRGLSVREAARLQSFEDKHAFSGPIGAQQQQVANAVPPLLARAVFSSLVELK